MAAQKGKGWLPRAAVRTERLSQLAGKGHEPLGVNACLLGSYQLGVKCLRWEKQIATANPRSPLREEFLM